MPEKPNGDNHENYEPDVEDLHDIVEFNVAVNALLRRARRLLGLAQRGMPSRILMMETAMTAESASRVAVLLAKSPVLLGGEHVTDVYQSQYNTITKAGD